MLSATEAVRRVLRLTSRNDLQNARDEEGTSSNVSAFRTDTHGFLLCAKTNYTRVVRGEQGPRRRRGMCEHHESTREADPLALRVDN
jgi:hypothetical protein